MTASQIVRWVRACAKRKYICLGEHWCKFRWSAQENATLYNLSRIKSKSQGTHPNWCLFYASRRRNLWGAICRGLQPIISRGAASSFCARLLDNHTRCRTLINCKLQLSRSRAWVVVQRGDAENLSWMNASVHCYLIGLDRYWIIVVGELMKILSGGVIIGFERKSRHLARFQIVL
jgi:hypothetical protein